MKTHILGICGTFMGGLAILAKQLNFKVSGSDAQVYPPMSTQLESQGIDLIQGFEEDQLNETFDEIVVGNVMRRGLPIVEALLNRGIPMISGPEWLARRVLAKRHVLAVSGTHGKTTTASMLAWILEFAGLKPGFLIGGVPNNFEVSARLGESPFFVVEADEYDSAFFDKRSKFIHYRPKTLIINNIEFDHADIFSDLAAIQTQFHHLIRIIPNQGLIVAPASDNAVNQVLQKGCWTPTTTFAIDQANFTLSTDSSSNSNEKNNKPQDWVACRVHADSSINSFDVMHRDKLCGTVKWNLLGQHNINNALAAMAAAYHVGVAPEVAIEALSLFKGVKRRLEIKGVINNITVYDDFAHHPTAIKTTLAGLRSKLGDQANIIAVVDIRSNTMKAGHHQDSLADSLCDANSIYLYRSADITWDVNKVWEKAQASARELNKRGQVGEISGRAPGGVYSELTLLLNDLLKVVKPKDHLVFMSNGGFGGIHNDFLMKCHAHNTPTAKPSGLIVD